MAMQASLRLWTRCRLTSVFSSGNARFSPLLVDLHGPCSPKAFSTSEDGEEEQVDVMQMVPNPVVSKSLTAFEIPTRKIVFQPDFTLGSQFAGVAVAKAEGIYAARGLEVEVLPPCAENPGGEVQRVVAMQAEMGTSALAVGSTEQNVLVAGQAHGGKVKAVSAMLQRTPLALGALPGTQIGSLSDLQGKTVGMCRDELPLFKGMAAVAGMHDVQVIEVTHEGKVQSLLDGTVDAIQIYTTTEVLQLQQQLGVPPNVLPLGSQPYDRGYAQVIFADAKALLDSPQKLAMRCFLNATYEGWKRAAADPWAGAQAVAVMTGEEATKEVLEFHRDVLLELLPFLEPEPGSYSGLISSFQLGSIDPSRWLSCIDTYAKAGLVTPRLAASVLDTADLSVWPGAPTFSAPGSNGTCKSIDGQVVAAQVRAEAKASAQIMLNSYGRRPGLAILRFGEVSEVEAFRRREVPAKQATSWYCMDKTGAALGVDVTIKRLPSEATQTEALAAVAELNRRPNVDAVMVELPVPASLNYDELLSQVDAQKRVDALEKHSLGALLIPDPDLKHTVPVSPTACMELLARAGVSVRGRKVTVVGYGRLVGAPLVQLLLQRGATVSICSSNTDPDHLKQMCLGSEIIISAAGVPNLITREHVPHGAAVINVGTVFDPERNILLPDVAPNVSEKASLVAGCPGGVGPIPVAVLMRGAAANAHRRNGATARIGEDGEDMYSVLCESDMEERELPAGWELGIRLDGSAYVCPDLGRPADGPIRDTSAISKTYAMPSFDAAVTFINEVAEVAATCGHHPDVRLTDFRHVRLELSSVTAGGVTVRDLEMAKRLDEVATKYIDQQ